MVVLLRMCLRIVSFKAKIALLWLAGAIALGIGSRPLLREGGTGSEVSSLAGLSGDLGQGITLAALGGYKNIAANFVWIGMYSEWQYRRKIPVLEKMKLAVSLNPDSVYFWVDGARIIANDMPVWRVGDEGMERLFDDSDAEGKAIREEYARQALRFLDKVPATLNDRYEIPLERGAIYWRRLNNVPQAIVELEKALRTPRPPYFLSRVYAELLYREGRIKEAYEYLKNHYDQLPEDDSRAMKAFVAQRIEAIGRELEAGE